MKRLLLFILVTCFAFEAAAQSLADAARKERERQQNSNLKSKFSFSNDNLQPIPLGDAPPSDGETTRYYPVRGTTPGELALAMSQLGPLDEDGKRYGGQTKWSVRWRYTTGNVDGQCGVTNVEAALQVDFTLPQWINEDAGTPALAGLWRKFSAALLTHERRHRDNGVAFVTALRKLRPAPQPECEALRAAMSDAGDALLEEYKANDARYDRETGHGRSQGASLQ